LSIDWSSLGEVAVVSIGVAVAVVVIFSLGVRILAAPTAEGDPRIGGEAGPATPAATGAPRVRTAPLPLFVAGLCFLACLAAVGYGLYLLIPQLH
jgi:hypothetical protein